MVTLLRKLFIKNYQDVQDPKVREKHGILASCLGIVINALLFIGKILVGIFAMSKSIISDAINNLTDFLSCFINLVGFKISAKPADKKHPYGHQRAEYIAGMIISFIIIALAIILGYDAITTLINKEEPPTYELYSFIILGVAILVKLFLAYLYYFIGKAISSESIKASMQDSLNDAICTSGVLICALISYFIKDLYWLDPSVSLLVAMFILYSGIKLIFETASPLLGVTPDENLIKQIEDDIRSYPNVLGIHDLQYHSYGHLKTFITLHVEIDGYMDMFHAHDLIDNIENDIAKKYHLSITIHMDPIDTKNDKLDEIKLQISDILLKINKLYTFHDVRLVAGPTHTNIVFDVNIPIEDKINDDALINMIKSEIKKIDNTYEAVIKIDRSIS